MKGIQLTLAMKLQGLAGLSHTLLKAFVAAAVLSVLPMTASADVVLTGNTFYAEDFETLFIGDHPSSSTGEVAWGGFGPTSLSRIAADQVDAANKVLDFDGLSGLDGPHVGRKALFSNAMIAAVPSVSSVSFRFYIDDVYFSADQRDMSLFMAMKDVNANTIATQNTLFGLKADPGVGGGPTEMLQIVTPGSVENIRSFVTDEWIEATIEYDLVSATDNITIKLNSASINNESFTFTKDLLGNTGVANTNGFYSFNAGSLGFGTGIGNKYDIDDINWLLAPVALDGDYNGNGTVDAADYTEWRDGNSPDSSIAGYNLWVANFGNGSSTSGAQSIPEPSSCLLLLGAVGVTLQRRRTN